MSLQIINYVNYHYEIIESIIVKYTEIIKTNKIDKIYLFVENNESFINYISNKYPLLIINTKKENNKYDFTINCTIYPKHYNLIKDKDKNTNFYISHRVNEIFKNMNNIFYLTPLCKNKNFIYMDILPFSKEKVKKNIPIYIIQGKKAIHRRSFKLLEKILQNKYNYEYKIKVIGRKKLNEKFNKYIIEGKLIDKTNLDFIEFHKEFCDCYAIIPLILKKNQPRYYERQITSSINYAKGYNLKCIIDKDSQDIYNLDNVEIFNDENDIVEAFKKSLVDFYK